MKKIAMCTQSVALAVNARICYICTRLNPVHFVAQNPRATTWVEETKKIFLIGIMAVALCGCGDRTKEATKDVVKSAGKLAVTAVGEAADGAVDVVSDLGKEAVDSVKEKAKEAKDEIVKAGKEAVNDGKQKAKEAVK